MHPLSRKIEDTNRQQADLLFGLIHVGPKMLRQFIDSTRKELDALRSLCHEALETARYEELVDPAFRVAHSIKGNASLFDLTAYREYADDLEDTLTLPKRQPACASEEWVRDILDKVAVMEAALMETRDLLDQLIELQEPAAKAETRTRTLLTNLRLLVDQLSATYRRRVQLYHGVFDLEGLPDAVYDDVVEILTQLVRNAVAHGIEPGRLRDRGGKSPMGRIYLETGVDEQHWWLRVQDDGRGPDLEKLREAARVHPACAGRDAEAMSNRELTGLIFLPGVSTARKPSDAAGRGVGMDLVRQRVEDLGGHIEIRFAVGQGLRFDILLPVTLLKDS